MMTAYLSRLQMNMRGCKGGIRVYKKPLPFSHSVAAILKTSRREGIACPGYKRLNRHFPHQSVDHTIGRHVVGAVHTNTIEGFWSILKRGVVGTYHKVSKKYLRLYVAEFQFRYNNRESVDILWLAITGC